MDQRGPLQATRAWTKAIAEHDAAMEQFLHALGAIPGDQWHVSSAPGKWTPAEEVLHVVLAYEIALRGVRTGSAMRLRVSPARARALRWLVLPVMLNTSWFPHARAPVEIRPPADASPHSPELQPAALRSRLEQRAREVRLELPASGPGVRFQHAYFGPLAPRAGIRMLAAHTQHHARALVRRFRNVIE